jgi:hypothetical protein
MAARREMEVRAMRLRGIGRPLVLLAVHFVALAGSTPAETAPVAVDLGTLGGT